MACFKFQTVCLAISLTACFVQARVGETQKQNEARYGGAGQELQDPGTLILKQAQNVVYHHGDWIITAAYVNHVTVRICYEKTGTEIPRVRLQREDVSEILEAEDAGGWTTFNETTQKAGKAYAEDRYPPPVLRSATGLLARYQVFRVTVEDPAAVHEDKALSPLQKRQSLKKRVAL